MHLLVAMALALVVAGPVASAQESRDSIKRAHEAALAQPFDDLALEAYLATLPVVEARNGIPLYVLEGDLLRTRDEVRVYLAAKAEKLKSQAAPGAPRGELIVATLSNGNADYWDSAAKRTLRYSVDRASFPSQEQYDLVVENMRAATADWEQVCEECGIRFIHVKEADAAPSHDKVTFIVAGLDSKGRYVAASFFPSDPVFRRFLYIDPSYFSTRFDRVGVLRHELGHILGYRHEHIRDAAGCWFEEGQWKPLTEYDPHSVMHYFCNGGGTMSLALTDVDKSGHRALYAVRTSMPAERLLIERTDMAARSDRPDAPNTLVIRFEGGEIGEDLTRVVKVLTRENLLDTHDYMVRENENLCQIYMRSIGFPARAKCPEPALRSLAADLNRTRPGDLAILSRGQTIRVPDSVRLRQYNYSRVFDLRQSQSTQQVDQAKAQWNAASSAVAQNKTASVTFEGYEIRLPSDDRERLARIQAELRSPNIYVNVVSPSLAKVPLHSSSHVTPSDHVQACRQSSRDIGEGDYLLMMRNQFDTISPALPQCALRCTAAHCAQIVMIDTPVYANADNRDAIKLGGRVVNVSTQPGGADRPPCLETEFNVEDHHGTHLASIMVSQENGFGFIGVSPGAELYSYDYGKLSDDELADLINQHMERSEFPSRKVFMFASTFRDYPTGVVDNQTFRLKTLSDRFDAKLAARRIKELQPLWIAAVGQPGEHSPVNNTVEITKYTPLSPMNLGDLPNVIIVTACDDCSDSGARLMPEAHYSSTGLVHIAAPGRNIPGWADAGSMTVAKGGTSQAAAFTAGVAASMQNCHPDYYTSASTTKQRLMVTARPTLVDDDAKNVRSGIVDINLALRDPTKNWLKRVGDVSLKEVAVDGWCVPAVHLSDALVNEPLADGYFDTSKIIRVTRSRRTGDDQAKRWVIFKLKGLDDIARSSAGTWNPTAKLLKLKNEQTPLSLDEIEELLLSRTLPQKPC